MSYQKYAKVTRFIIFYAVKKGDRVAQLVLEKIMTPEVVEVERKLLKYIMYTIKCI